MPQSFTFHSNLGMLRIVPRFGQVFGYCLLFVAVLRIFPLVAYVWDAARMTRWTPTPAILLEAGYQPVEVDGSPQVTARYRYRFGWRWRASVGQARQPSSISS